MWNLTERVRHTLKPKRKVWFKKEKKLLFFHSALVLIGRISPLFTNDYLYYYSSFKLLIVLNLSFYFLMLTPNLPANCQFNQVFITSFPYNLGNKMPLIRGILIISISTELQLYLVGSRGEFFFKKGDSLRFFFYTLIILYFYLF